MAVRGSVFDINEPCDFIFDNQDGVSEQLSQQWPDFKRSALCVSKSDFPNFLGERPIFQNDKCFKPLQAADLYANQYRYHLERNSGRLIVPPNNVLRQFLPLPMIDHDCTVEELESFTSLSSPIQRQDSCPISGGRIGWICQNRERKEGNPQASTETR